MSRMLKTTLLIDGEHIIVEGSQHAEERMLERGLDEYEVYSLILRLGEELLDMKNGEEFAVLDKELGTAIVCSINVDSAIYVDIITCISDEKVFISRGTKTYKLSSSRIEIVG